MRMRSTVLGAGLGALVRNVPIALPLLELNVIFWVTIKIPQDKEGHI